MVIGAVVAGVLVVLAGVIGWIVRSRWPKSRGRIRIPGLRGPVEVVRDEHGVPHIYASSTQDLFLAQGFVHAQDRLFQMDLQRRAGLGALSELFGERAIPVDRTHRIFGFRRGAYQDLAALDDQARQALDAYTTGVNAFIAQGRRPLEYVVLRARPTRWSAVDTLAWVKVMQWELTNDANKILVRKGIVEAIGPEMAAALYPDFADDPTVHSRLLAGEEPTRILEWAAAAGMVPGVSGADRVDGLGSNVIVVGPSRSTSGKPLVANDTHLALGMPGVWYQIGLHAPGYDCAGMSMPGMFGVVIGHNDRIAWGVATLPARVQDLYEEELNPDNPQEYLVGSEYVPFTVVNEEIGIRGRDPVTIQVRLTRHGPVLTDADDGTRADPQGVVVTRVRKTHEPAKPRDRVMALRWQPEVEPSTLVNSILPLNKAEDWTEFTAALRSWDAPSMTFVYADVDGNIGSHCAGRIPVREQGAAALPVPGASGDHEWICTVPFDELPHSYNPASAVIIAANANPAGPGYRHFLAPEWCSDNRERRILERICERPSVSGEDLADIQMDTVSLMARRFTPFLVAAPVRTELAVRVQRQLATWDHKMTADSVPGGVYLVALRTLVGDLVGPLIGAELTEKYLTREQQYTPFVDAILDQPDSEWWTRDGHTMQGRIAEALESSVAWWTEKFGSDTTQWGWGRVHRARFVHPIYSSLPVLRKLGNADGGPADGDPQSPLATSFYVPYDVAGGPAHRHVVDLADWDSFRSVVTVGQSGHLLHRNYKDLLPLWRTGRTVRLPWTESAVRAAGTRTLRLEPEVAA